MVATCRFSSVRNLLALFPGSAHWMFLTTEVTETCQDQDVKVGLERLSPYYRKIYFSSKMIAKNPLDNLMSFVAGYFQSLLQGSDPKNHF